MGREAQATISQTLARLPSQPLGWSKGRASAQARAEAEQESVKAREALRNQVIFGGRLGTNLLETGAVTEADLAIAQLRKALDAFARLDTERALEVLKQDDQIDQEFDGLMRKLITYMMEDPRTISASIDLVFVAKAIERVGDHAKNLAEQIIYIVKGTDVRHNPLDVVESVVR